MAFPSEAQLTDVLSPLLAQWGLLVEQIKITKAGAKSAVRIAVDTADPSSPRPDLDGIEEVSKAISSTFDRSEEEGQLNFGPGYTLEVSTPGLDFPLSLGRHWARNIGRLVDLPQEGQARVLQVDGGGVILLLRNKRQKKVVNRQLEEIRGAVVEVEFNKVPQDEHDLVGQPRQSYEPEMTS